MKALFTLGDAVVNAETCYTDVLYPDAECGRPMIPASAGHLSTRTRCARNLRPSSPTSGICGPRLPFSSTDSTRWPVRASRPMRLLWPIPWKSVVEQGVHSLYFTTKGWQSFADPPADITTVVQDIANAAN